MTQKERHKQVLNALVNRALETMESRSKFYQSEGKFSDDWALHSIFAGTQPLQQKVYRIASIAREVEDLKPGGPLWTVHKEKLLDSTVDAINYLCIILLGISEIKEVPVQDILGLPNSAPQEEVDES